MKRFSPTTPGRRQMTVVDMSVLTRSEPEKALTHGFSRSMGRNNQGRITTRHKGGGHKRKYREIDFREDKRDIPARILSFEYDPNRTSFIALVCYRDGEKRYVLMPQSVAIGEEIVTSEHAPIKPG